MAKVEELTVASVLNLFSYQGLYVVLYAWLFGMLSYDFPIYFVVSIALTSGLALLWTFSHPDVFDALGPSFVYVLSSILFAQGANYFVIGPMTSRTMFERHRLEKEEGKVYNEPGVSDAMKALNRRFGSLHGISSLLNLWAVIAAGMHGLWIGNAGVKGY
ncbi:hypothetical protein BT96DRAFT_961468 [Gymnopus androsaceus JB14]|uniref:TMEM205-like domain-containing protein n=1 Tax=Gymnopus androsaceus JB14 TaxID=1447944 RepID=A0A6A4IRX1_9AGAR|nr:hypothetical protein BT96DRAFT_961468 [Gymnopus androsaceus JB14]